MAIAHGEYRDILVHRAGQGSLAHAAPVHGNPRKALIELQSGGRKVSDRQTNYLDGLVQKLRRVPPHHGFLCRIERVVTGNQQAAHHGSTVTMRLVEHYAVAGKSELLLAALRYNIPKLALGIDQVNRLQHGDLPGFILQSQGLHVEILANTFRRMIPKSETGHPDGLFGSNDGFGDACLPAA